MWRMIEETRFQEEVNTPVFFKNTGGYTHKRPFHGQWTGQALWGKPEDDLSAIVGEGNPGV